MIYFFKSNKMRINTTIDQKQTQFVKVKKNGLTFIGTLIGVIGRVIQLAHVRVYNTDTFQEATDIEVLKIDKNDRFHTFIGNLKDLFFRNFKRVYVVDDGFFIINNNESTVYAREIDLETGINVQGWIADNGLIDTNQPISTIDFYDLDNIIVELNGVVKHSGTIIAQIALSKFPNPAGLQIDENGYYIETANSGQAQTGEADQNGYGYILAEEAELPEPLPTCCDMLQQQATLQLAR